MSSVSYILLGGLVYFFHVGMDAGTFAGHSLPRATAQLKPFADQLADTSAYHSILKLECNRLTRVPLHHSQFFQNSSGLILTLNES